MCSGDWNQKNRELYEATVNRANNTCTLNPYRTKYLELTNNIMTFELFTIELNCHSRSWISVFGIAFGTVRYTRNLFLVEWNYERRITNLQLLWFFDWRA